jgi:hypothetical protein
MMEADMAVPPAEHDDIQAQLRSTGVDLVGLMQRIKGRTDKRVLKHINEAVVSLQRARKLLRQEQDTASVEVSANA